MGLESSISRNIINFFRAGFFLEKKCFFSRKDFEVGVVKYKKLFNLGARKFHFTKYKKKHFQENINFNFNINRFFFISQAWVEKCVR